MTRRIGRLGLLVAAMLAISATSALGATLTVAPRKASFGCAAHEQYSTISAAVTAANPGDQITVCPGTYQEQVTIAKPNLTLMSQAPLQATIKAPTSMSAPGAVVSITSTNVKLTGFTITSSGQNTTPNCANNLYGIYVSNGGSADAENNDISDISDAPISGCQHGVAVEAGDSSIPTSGSVTLKHDTIEDYQKNGVTVDSPGSSGDIEQNTIIGVGPTNVIAQNGIQISSGATGTIKNNTVSNNVYSPGTTASTGILLCGPGQTDTESNTVSTNDVGIYDAANDGGQGCASPTTPKATISTNTIVASTFDGVVLDADHGPQVKSDVAAGTWGNSAYPDTDAGDGFDVFNATTTALLQGDMAPGNSADGFHNESDSSGNTYSGNQAPANLKFDCEDDTTPLANTWMNDQGDINSPPSLCKGNPSVASAASSSASPQARSLSQQSSKRRPAPSPAG